MKAIETRYAGCHFRSRLEARWAVFFDHIGWAWEYEPQGFDLPSGRYLPDFRVTLPSGDLVWVEVKGVEPTQRERRLMVELVHQHLGAPSDERMAPKGLILTQIPRFGGSELAWRFSWDSGDGEAYVLSWSEKFDRAFEAARSARFEHGQSGPT